MDPDTALAELLEARKRWQEAWEACPEGEVIAPESVDALVAAAQEMGWALDALDLWLTGGGFPPKRWPTA